MTLEDALEEIADDASRAIAEEWRDEAIAILRDVGSRLDYDVEPVIKSATPVTPTSDGYSFTFTHPASAIFHFGSEPHTIEADDDGFLVWQQDGETIFAKEVDHPGTSAILFVSKSQQKITEQGLRDSGEFE